MMWSSHHNTVWICWFLICSIQGPAANVHCDDDTVMGLTLAA